MVTEIVWLTPRTHLFRSKVEQRWKSQQEHKYVYFTVKACDHLVAEDHKSSAAFQKH